MKERNTRTLLIVIAVWAICTAIGNAIFLLTET